MALSVAAVRRGSFGLVTILWAPRAAALRSSEGCLAAPVFAVLLTGVLWAVLCLVLQLNGHAPSVVLLPVPRHIYYAVQAVLLPGLLVLGWLLLSVVSARIIAAPWRSMARALAPAYAGGLLWFLVVPDVLGYGVWGFEGLAKLVRITGPMVLLGTWWWAALAVSSVFKVDRARAALASFAGLVAQAVLLALVLR